MAGETTWTADDLATLERAIASGVMTVSYSGPPARTVTYQSIDAMLRARATVRAELIGDQRPAVRYASLRKGF